MEKVLYDERKDLANQMIVEHKHDATMMTRLITAFNNLPVVAPIKTAEQAKKFLSGPVAYLDERVLADTGIQFAGGARPTPRVVAQMFEIGYSSFVETVSNTRLSNSQLSRFTFDESSGKVELNPEAEQQIREDCKIYITPGADTEEFNHIQQLADTINELAPRYNIDGTDLHRVVAALRFFRTVAKPGGGWMLAPEATEIKKALGRIK